MGAKPISKWGMICGGLIIILYNFIYLVITKKIPTPEEQKSIIYFGGSIVILFTPVYISIILDKLTQMFKKGK